MSDPTDAVCLLKKGRSETDRAGNAIAGNANLHVYAEGRGGLALMRCICLARSMSVGEQDSVERLAKERVVGEVKLLLNIEVIRSIKFLKHA